MDDKNKPQNISYYSKLVDLSFYVLSSDEILSDSNVHITNKEIMKNDKPAPDGLHDTRMGTTSFDTLCGTCGCQKAVCPGHFGSIDLRYPVKSPMFRDELLKWLKVVCYHCGELVVKSKILVPPVKRLSELVKNVKAVKECPYCEQQHMQVVKDKKKPFIFWRVHEEGKKILKKEEFYNHHIKTVLERIRPDNVIKQGKPLRSHPRNFILTTVSAPPNTIRPDLRRLGGARSSNSDTTSLLKTIFEINQMLPEEIPVDDQITQPMKDAYANLDMAYFSMVKGGGGGDVKMVTNSSKPPVAIAERFPKKPGRIRRNLMGKRVAYMIRSVITGDSRLKINQVGVPMIHAKDLEIPEKVTTQNRERLMRYFNNGTKQYPGCKHIIKASNGDIYRRDLLDANYVLKLGDTVMRDMISGDYVCFNRQPSIIFTSIAGMEVVVMEVSDTLRINPSICSLFNADFDGDQMNAIVVQNIQARNECMTISKAARWFVSPQSHKPLIGAFQDGLIGLSELSKDGLTFNKWHAMQMFGDIHTSGLNYDFAERNYANRELISRLLPKINVSNKTPSFYKSQYTNFIKYNPIDIKVNIVRGELQSGVIDKAIAGQGVAGSIFHVIAKEYGNNVALESVYNLQQIVHRFFGYHGFTVGIADINISEPSMIEIKSRLTTMILNSRKITQRLNSGKLIAPLGTDLYDFYEAEQLGILSAGDDFANPILSDIDLRSNQLAKLILSGSKGALTNYININACLGMTTINGGRFGNNQAGWGRKSPYFVRYDAEPEANGFLSMSFREGVRNDVYAFTAAEGREGAISNALKTSVTGYQNRISIKNLETIITDNLRKSAKGMNVIQPIYAECGLDLSKMEKVNFPTIKINDATFEKDYRADVKMFAKQFQNNNTANAIKSEFEQLKADRDQYRSIHMILESHNPKEYIMSDDKQMPVNVRRIIDDAVYNYIDLLEKLPASDKVLDPLYTITVVKDLCSSIGYAFLNEMQQKLKRRIPKHIVATTTMLQILIRSYLCTSYLVKKGVVNALLDIIVQRIVLMFKKSLIDYGTSVGIIAAQCVSEPMTQYVLNSKHRAGGGGGTRTNTIDRIKEILGAKPTLSLKNPHMLIMVKPEYETDKIKVQEIANHIEMMAFSRFISNTRIFFEPYGAPVHPDFIHEKKDIAEFEKHNFGQKVPGDLAKWCIRFGIDKEELLLKSMKLETVILAIRKAHPELFVMYTPENADEVFIRCYLRNSMFKQSNNYYSDIVLYIMEEVKKVIVRGVKDIMGTSIIDVLRNEVQPDGSLAMKTVYGIYSNGTNLSDVLSNPYVDPYRTQSDSIEEIQRIFGVTAARNKIINEMILAMDSLIRMHCSVFADEMCYAGQVSNIQKTGLQKRENANVTLRLSFQTAVQVIQDAAIHGLVDHISGISGPLIMGTNPSIGTTYNSVVVNRQFIEENARSLESIAEDL